MPHQTLKPPTIYIYPTSTSKIVAYMIRYDSRWCCCDDIDQSDKSYIELIKQVLRNASGEASIFTDIAINHTDNSGEYDTLEGILIHE